MRGDGGATAGDAPESPILNDASPRVTWRLSSSSDPVALAIVDGLGRWSAAGPHYSRRTPGRSRRSNAKNFVLFITKGIPMNVFRATSALKSTLVCLASLTLGTSCLKRVGDWTLLSSRSPSTIMEKGVTRVSGGSCSYSVFFGLITFGHKDLKEATDEAIEMDSQRRDVLMDVVVYEKDINLFWLYTVDCFEVAGTPARVGPRIEVETTPINLDVAPSVKPSS